MRLTPWIVLIGALATACGGGADALPQGADRSVEGVEQTEFDPETAILRTQIVARSLEDGLSRNAAACMVDAALVDISLDRIADFDLSAKTGSDAAATEAMTLADALVACGTPLRSLLEEAAPGAYSIPPSHGPAGECFRAAFFEAIHSSYISRFRGQNGDGPHDVDIVVPLRACDAAGGLVLGASNEGLREVAELSTLEWICLVDRLPSSTFEAVFPFPDEPGDAVARLGSRVSADIEFCGAWVIGAGAATATDDPGDDADG